MTSAQQSNEQVQQFSNMQSKAFQPMRIFGGFAAEAMEQVARKNYAVMGDFIEFSVKQVQLPLSSDNARDILSAQMEELSAFGELMNNRASEYVELISTLSENSRKAADDAAVQVREVADEAAKQTRQAVDKAVVSTQEAAEKVAEQAEQATDEVSNNVKEAADEAGDRTKKAADDISNNAKKAADDLKDTSTSASNRTKKTATRAKKSTA